MSSTITLPFTRSHAFIIGINDYLHVSPLKTAVNDAIAIAHKLKSEHGYEIHGPLLNPTRAEMLDFLALKMMQEIGENDRVIFYFAGHGIALDGENGPNGYLVPADAKHGVKESLIPMEDLHWTLNELPCRHGLLILDCCFSGAFKWSSGYRDLVFDLPKVIYEERFWRYVKDQAWQVITSSAYDQKAVDVITNQSLGMREEGEEQHSPFAYALMEAISGKADVIPAGKGDGVITASELYSYLRDVVESETNQHVKRQSPSMFNLSRHGKGEFIFLDPYHQFNLPPTPDRNPFKGLSSYDEADSSLYFGRDRVVEALLNHVYCHSMVVVSGASGTGKSSLIKAGLLPILRENDGNILPIIRPGKMPMETLQIHLPRLTQQLKSGKSFVLVIDQYEELLTQCLDPEDRIAFEQQLADWLDSFPNLFIIISIRSDFEAHFEQHGLARWWQEGRFVVPGFTLDEYREVITKPTGQEVLFFEPDELVDLLVAEVSQAPGALPLLSFTLSELYHAYLKSGREDRALTLADYQQLGGVIGALRTRADAEYTSLGQEEQNTMRKLMMRMVSLEGGELAGKRIYEEELVFSDEQETVRMKRIANRLTRARLLLKGKDSQGRVYVEPAHDALVRAWARLWEWIKTVGEEKITLQYKLSQAVNDYHELVTVDPQKAKNLLWNNNPRLDLLKAEMEEASHGLNKKEEAFVLASLRRRVIRKRVTWGLAVATMLGLAILSITAFIQANNARKQRDQALSNGLASRSVLIKESDPTIAFRLAEEALRANDTNSAAIGALLNSFYYSINNTPEKIKSGFLYQKVDSLPSDLAFQSAIRQAPPQKVRQSFAQEKRRYPYVGDIQQSFYSPAQRYFFQVSEDGNDGYSAWIYNMVKRKFLHIHKDIEGSFSDHLFSSDDRFAVIPVGNKAEIFQLDDARDDLASYELVAPFPLTKTVFAADDQHVYGAIFNGDGYKWDLTGYPIERIGHKNQFIEGIYIDSLSDRIVIDYAQDRVEVWKKGKAWELEKSSEEGVETLLSQTYQYHELKEPRFSKTSIARDTSRNGKYEITVINRINVVQISAIETKAVLVELIGHKGKIISIDFSPDGRFILTSSDKSEVKMWDWNGDNIFSVALSGMVGFFPDGKTIFVKEQAFGEAKKDEVFGDIDLISIDPNSLIQWANEHEVYQLSQQDKLEYGLEADKKVKESIPEKMDKIIPVDEIKQKEEKSVLSKLEEEKPEEVLPALPGINDVVAVDQTASPTNIETVRQEIGYPQIAQEAEIEGRVVSRVLVGRNGDYLEHKIIQTPHPLLATEVSKHINKMRFTPAQRNGQAVASWINIPFNFEIEKPAVIPDINAFIFAEEEPKPSNMNEVQALIGYPQIARDAGIEGNVVVRVLVDRKGNYAEHKVINKVHPILSEAVENHISKLVFTPAKQGGKPIYFWVNIPFNFKLLN